MTHQEMHGVKITTEVMKGALGLFRRHSADLTDKALQHPEAKDLPLVDATLQIRQMIMGQCLCVVADIPDQVGFQLLSHDAWMDVITNLIYIHDTRGMDPAQRKAGRPQPWVIALD